MRYFLWILIPLTLIFSVYQLWPEDILVHEPGILVSNDPLQENIENGKPWLKDDYMITPLAKYEIKARVLSRERYRFDKSSDLSPIDLALGWGVMSDQKIVDQFSISQHGRWYFWKSKHPPIPNDEVSAHSANTHILPADDTIADEVTSVRTGDVVHLKGYLVRVSSDKGFRWKSSVSRTDTGDGSCEVMWVESVSVENPD